MIEWSAGHGLNLRRAEEIILLLAPRDAPHAQVVLDMSQCRHIDVGAGWRLGNALRRLQDSHLTIRVPEPGDFTGFWFLHFTRSGLGLSIAHHARRVEARGVDITERVKHYYAKPRQIQQAPQELGGRSWISTNFCLIPDLHKASFNPEHEGQFRTVLHTLLPYVGIDERVYGQVSLRAIASLLFEAIQNVYDHAARLPLSRGTTILSYLALRSYRRINNPKAFTSDFPSYLAALAEQGLATDEGFVELVVADDGIGIPARQGLSEDVYWKSFQREETLLREALADHGSVKINARDAPVRGDPGYGFSAIQRALHNLGAFAVLRTGRSLVAFDAFRGRPDFDLKSEVGYMPGTVLQVVFPLTPATLFTI